MAAEGGYDNRLTAKYVDLQDIACQVVNTDIYPT